MSQVGFENAVLIAKNISFDYTAPNPHIGLFTTNGGLLIGSTANPNICALQGQLVSPLGTLSIGYSAPNITIDLVAGAASITLTGNTGGPIISNSFTFSGGATGLSFNGAGTTFTTTFAGITANNGVVNLGTDNTANNINIGTNGTRTVNLATGTTGNTNIGSFTGANALSIHAGTGGMEISPFHGGTMLLGDLITTGTMTIGNSNMTGTMRIGDGNGQTVFLGSNGTFASATMNISTSVSNPQTVHIADGADGNLVYIGSSTGASQTTINSGSLGLITTGVAGVAVGNLNVVTIDTVTGQLGSEALPSSSVTFTGDTGTPFATNAVTIFANNATNLSGGTVLFNAATPNVTLQLSDSAFNTYLGQGCGANSSPAAGGNNTAVGFDAMNSVNAGTQNTAFGFGALFGITNNSNNCAFGYRTLVNCSSGSDNIAIGSSALVLASSSSQNVCIGSSAGASNTTGGGNVLVGYIAGTSISNGFNNTIIGTNAGFGANCTRNILIGYRAGANLNTTNNDNIIIGSDGLAPDASLIRIGTAGTHNSTFISGIASVAVSNLNLVTINTATGQLGSQSSGGIASSFPTDSGTATPAAGVLNIKAANGVNNSGSTVSFSAPGSSNLVLLNVTDGNSNTAIGNGASNVSASGNTVLGASAVSNSNGTGNNTVIGFNASAAQDSNVLIGSNGVCPGYKCVFIGESVGASSGDLYSTYIGGLTGTNSTGGQNNLYLGYAAGNAIGANTGNNIMLGHSGSGGDSNTIRIGIQGTQTKSFMAGVTGVSVSNLNVVTIDTTTGQLGSQAPTGLTIKWSVIAANQTAAVSNGYFANKAGTLALLLPATSAVGDIIEVANINTAAGTQITQAAGQQIFLPGNTSSTVGVGGSVTSTSIGDTLKLVCRTANLVWQIISINGSWVVV